ASFSSFGAGFLFGIGLWLSGMANPRKVLDFLDVAGDWDPSLLLVMAGAVAVTAVFFRPLIRKKQVTFERTAIDAPLVIGAAVFGIGWGIGGYCPGPALTALSNLSAEALVFVAAMVAGGMLAKIRLSPGSLAQR
ncbi:MAG: YeeE/YedE family protein, partial [Betaproteobacteria bacterium]